MKIYRYYLCCIILVIARLDAFHVDAVNKTFVPKMQPTLPVVDFFSCGDMSWCQGRIVNDPYHLQQAARDALRYFSLHFNNRKVIVDPVCFSGILSFQKTRETLQFIVDTIEADKKNGNFRILNQRFLRDNFGTMRWSADSQGARSHNVHIPNDGRIRLTTYGILVVNGRLRKSADFPCGLYELRDDSIRKKYTKRQILSGALESSENRAKRRAIAWVCRQDLEDALMQGTIIVKCSDGKSKILNVDKDNGIPYDRKEKNILLQKRYWFFRELAQKDTKAAIARFKNRKNTVFAGDLYHIGLGKVIALCYQNPVSKQMEMRLGVLADTGGAFMNNLYQLDLFGGVFESRAALKHHLTLTPVSAYASVLYKK